MKPRTLIRTAFALIAILSAGEVVAAVSPHRAVAAAHLYVSAGSSGTSCTQAAPCGSIRQALELARDGQNVIVSSGTYSDETLRDSKAGSRRSIRAVVRPAPGATARLAGRTYITGSHIEIRGFVIEGVLNVIAPSDDIILDGLRSDQAMIQLRGGTNVMLKNSVLQNNRGADFVQVGGGSANVSIVNNRIVGAYDSAPSDPLHLDCIQVFGPVTGLNISGNVIARCANAPMMISTNQGPITGMVIERNTIQACFPRTTWCYSHYGVQINEGAGGSLNGAIVRNNVIDGGLLIRPGVQVRVSDNVLSDPENKEALNAPCSPSTFSNNVIQRDLTCSGRAVNNTIATPLYVDRGNLDLRIRAGAPGSALGAGAGANVPTSSTPRLSTSGLAVAVRLNQVSAPLVGQPLVASGPVPPTIVQPTTVPPVPTPTGAEVAEIVGWDFTSSDADGRLNTRSGSQIATTLDVEAGSPAISESGLTFSRPVTLTTQDASGLLVGASTTTGITIESWVAPRVASITGPRRIVSMSTSPWEQNFLLGHGSASIAQPTYTLRVRTTGNEWIEISAPIGSATTDITHLVASIAPDGSLRMYVNGTLQAEAPGTAGGLRGWDASMPLAIGDIPGNQSRPFIGNIRGVAIYPTVMDAASVAARASQGPAGFNQPLGQP